MDSRVDRSNGILNGLNKIGGGYFEAKECKKPTIQKLPNKASISSSLTVSMVRQSGQLTGVSEMFALKHPF